MHVKHFLSLRFIFFVWLSPWNAQAEPLLLGLAASKLASHIPILSASKKVLDWFSFQFPKPGEEPVEPQINFNGNEIADAVLRELRNGFNFFGVNDIPFPGFKAKFGGYMAKFENAKLRNIANMYRVGNVTVNVSLIDTKITWGIQFKGFSYDADVGIVNDLVNFPNGHIHYDLGYSGVCVVIKLDYATQCMFLDELEFGLGKVNWTVTGLGDLAEEGTQFATDSFNYLKDNLLKWFNYGARLLFNYSVNIAWQALRGVIKIG